MPVLQQVADGGHRREGHAERLRQLDDLLRRVLSQPRQQQLIELPPLHHAVLAALEERVLIHVRVPQQERHGRYGALLCDAALGEALHTRHNNDMPVLTGHDVHRVAEDVPRVVAAADRSLEGVHGRVVLVGAGGGLRQRDVDVLASFVSLAVGQRRLRADPGVDTGDVLSRDAACGERLPVRIAGVVHERAHRHGGEAVPLVALVRPRRAEGSDGDADELREVALQVIVAQAPLRHASRPRALDEHVRLLEQLLEDDLAGGDGHI